MNRAVKLINGGFGGMNDRSEVEIASGRDSLQA
jgi:hypothetical protein